MSLLLPQNREATVLAVRAVDLHGDAFLDVTLDLGGGQPPLTGRVGAGECPVGLQAGERVVARIVVGVVTRLERS